MSYKVTVEPVLFFYMLSIYMLLPASQDLIYTKVCLKTYTFDVCNNLYKPENENALDDVETSSSHWILGSTLMLALPSMFSSQFLGSWSDTYGRKIPLLFPPIGNSFSALIFIGMSSYLRSWPVSLVLLASFLSGICGSFSSCFLTCMSYISQASDLRSRTFRIAVLESMNLFGGTFGPLLTSWIQNGLGRASCFFFIMSFNAAAVVYTVIFVRNLTPRFPSEDSWRKLLDLKHLKDSLLTLFRTREENRRTYILLLLLSIIILFVMKTGELDVLYIYVKDTPIEWSMNEYNRFSSIRNCLGGIGLLVLLPLFRRFSDSVLISVGICTKILTYILLGVAKGSLVLYIAACVSLLINWSTSTIRSSMSKLVAQEEQGKLFASIALMESCCSLVGTALFNGIYPATRGFFKGFLFIMAACFLLISLGITFYLHKPLKRFSNYEKVEEDHGEGPNNESDDYVEISGESATNLPSPSNEHTEEEGGQSGRISPLPKN